MWKLPDIKSGEAGTVWLIKGQSHLPRQVISGTSRGAVIQQLTLGMRIWHTVSWVSVEDSKGRRKKD